MTLLTEIFDKPLDPGYAAAAQRRERLGLAAAPPGRSPLLAVTALLIGLLMAIAATSLATEDTSRAAVRSGLIQQIEQRRELVEQRSAAVNAVSSHIATLESQSLAGQSRQWVAETEGRRAQAAALAVTGPGLRVSMDDRAGATAADDDARVLSRDLFIVVNGLWRAGAEAIAVNGQRLGPRSPIRFAGDAILVNFRPLSPPYLIAAIGDPDTFPADFAAGVGAAYLKSISDNFGIRTSVESADRLELPAAPTGRLNYATSVKEGPS